MTPVLGAVSQFSLELFFLLSSYPFGKIYFPDREISLARFSFLDYPFYTFFFFFFLLFRSFSTRPVLYIVTVVLANTVNYCFLLSTLYFALKRKLIAIVVARTYS